MPKLSIIIPVYNAQEYLSETLDSLIHQTYTDIEIICVNDDSTDKSLNILEKYAKNDSRIKIINKKNGGPSSARNAGLKVAQADYVAFVDADDLLEKNTYEIAMSKVENADIVCFGVKVFGDSSEKRRKSDEKYYEIKYNGLVEVNDKIKLSMDVSPCNKIFKMDIIKKNNILYPEGLYYEDANFYWKYMSYCSKAYMLQEYFYNYRRHENSTMGSTFKGSVHAIDHLHILKDVYDFWQKNNLLDANYGILKEIFKSYTLFSHKFSPYNMKTNVLEKAQEYAKIMFKDKKQTTFISNIIKSRWDDLYEPELTLFQKIFSIINVEKHKVLCLLGVKVKIKNKYKILQNEVNFMKDEIAEVKNANQHMTKIHEYHTNILVDLYLDNLNLRRIDTKFDENKFFDNIKYAPKYLPVDSSQNYLNILLGCKPFYFEKDSFNTDCTIISWETARWPDNLKILLHSIKQNKDIIFIGDSFLRSIEAIADVNADTKYKKGISFGIDDLGYYYDATRPTRMEQMLNDKNLIITEEQRNRAKNCINKVIANYLTKYNHQPIYEPKIGRNNAKKVLVVDQSYGDMSIAKGLADENTFNEMLQTAIKENPDADIIVKTHPDTIAGTGGYYKGVKQHNNIYTQTEPINPISLIKYVDKVYVCTTQLGFEALMCGKEVHVFGMPFYAGWGLTIDKQKCERRTNTRTLEEVFYIAYIMYSHYVNPEKNCRCEIEEAMDYLLKLREEYFSEKA